MIGTLIILSLLSTGLIYTMIYPVLLSPKIVNSLTSILTPIFAFNFIFPIKAIFECVNFTLQILVLYMVYRLVMGLIGLINGSGKPDLE